MSTTQENMTSLEEKALNIKKLYKHKHRYNHKVVQAIEPEILYVLFFAFVCITLPLFLALWGV